MRNVLSNRWLLPLSLLAAALILGNSLLSYGNLQLLRDNDVSVSHTESVRAELNRLLVSLDDAETGQRGYLLTGDAAYLRPYTTARARIGAELANLAALTRDNPTQRRNLGRLIPLTRAKLAELEQTVALRRQGRQAEALRIVRTNTGQRSMDEIRGVVAAMSGEEDALLAGRTAEARASARTATVTLALATLADLALLALATVFIGRGLAERARAAAERGRVLEQEAELLRAANQRMDEFLSIVTHELRSPLTSAKGNVQLAARRVQSAAKRLDALAQAHVDGRASDATDSDLAGLFAGIADLLARTDWVVTQMTRLVADLLDAARAGAGRLEIAREEADLAAIVASVVEEQRRAWPTRTILLDIEAELVPVEIDPVRVTQVLTNYIANACKYSDPARPVAVALRREGAEAWVRVRDEGVGLTPEQQQRVWDRFHRVADVAVLHHTGGSGGGLGLGLYISRQLIEGQGGRVGVESAPGEGSTFWFTLPLNEQGAGRALRMAP